MAELWALSDLHLAHEANRATVAQLPARPHDWLVLAGDLGERDEHLAWAFATLAPRWQRVVWVPGNHELWTTSEDAQAGRYGEAKYRHLVELARRFGVMTPEDPYEPLPGPDALWVCPLFLLYDYSFGPDGLTPAEVVAWAAEDGIVCADERLLSPAPYPSRASWCRVRVEESAARLEAELPRGARSILINHWPLRADLVRLYRIPRFVPWCGTRRTEDWHNRFRAALVVSGHLHMRATDWRDGVRFEEVSLGYPRHWRPEVGAPGYLRRVWPGEPGPPDGWGGPHWHR